MHLQRVSHDLKKMFVMATGLDVAFWCRVNTINGLAYKDDPAIFSWNIFNEPRCSQVVSEDDSCKPSVQKFIDTMAAYIKGIDKNHMVRT